MQDLTKAINRLNNTVQNLTVVIVVIAIGYVIYKTVWGRENERTFYERNQAWSTPQHFYDQLNEEFNFTLDPCCSKETAKCEKFYTEEDDGLSKSWKGETVFMNPPYGRAIKDWIYKAHNEWLLGATVVCLIPSRTDTRYWHDWIFPYYNAGLIEIRFLKGRLAFGTLEYWHSIWDQEFIDGKKNNLFGKYGKKNSAPFPSAVIVYKERKWTHDKIK